MMLTNKLNNVPQPFFDAHNDIIATEAGSQLSNSIRNSTVNINSLGSLQNVINDLFNEARRAFLLHNVNQDRHKVMSALYSVHFTLDENNNYLTQIIEPYHNQTIWKKTLGDWLERNREYYSTADDREAFLNKIRNHFVATNNWSQLIADVNMDIEDIEMINQLIELIGLLDEEIPGQRE